MKFFVRLIVILFGSILIGAAVGLLISPNSIAPGGVTGIAVMLSKLSGANVGAIVMLINIPLLAIGRLKLGREFFWLTLFATVASSVFIDVFSYFEPLTNDILLASLSGGTLMAIGIGIVFRQEATTGGIDIIVRLIKQRLPHIKTGVIFLAIDGAVAITSGFVFNSADIAMYSVISLVCSSTAMNLVLYGTDEAKLMLIICNDTQGVLEALTVKLGVGASMLEAVGGFTQRERTIVMCAVKNYNLHKARRLINEVDSTAFLIVSSATEIYGEGFKSYNQEDY